MSPGNAPSVIAVDAGSSRLRVSVLSLEDASVLQSAARPTRAAGGELELDGLWKDLVEVVSEFDVRGSRIVGIGVAAQLGIAVVDERGRVLRPAILWGDVRAAAEADRLADTLPKHAATIAGRRLTAELPIAKLRWLSANEPSCLQRAARILSLKDALVQRLTGRAITDETHASYSGLFDVTTRAWSSELLAGAGIDPGLLPPTRPGCATAGGLTPEAAAELNLAPGTPVAVGGPDGTLGVIGAGGVRGGVTVDVAGTTDVILHTTDRPVGDATGATVLNAHVLPGLWTAGGPTGLTGGAVEWTARVLGYPSASAAHDALGSEMSTLVGADGVTFLTTLSGARFPTWETAQAGMICGLRPHHRPAHLLRAAQEGSVFAVGEGLQAIRALGLELDQVVVVGGAAARAAGLQLRSDAWQAAVVSLVNNEATTIGAAIMAGVAGGAFSDASAGADVLVSPAHRYEPRHDTASTLAKARARWRAAASFSAERSAGSPSN